MGKRKLGKGDLKEDELGVWIEAQLNLRDEYEKAIYELVEKGKLGWSSAPLPPGRAGGEGQGALYQGLALGLDASLTPTPAERGTR